MMTFTVGGDGYDGDFNLYRAGFNLGITSTSTLNMTIWDTTGTPPDGVPNNPLPLATAIETGVGIQQGYINFTFDNPIALVNGTQYAFSISATSGGGTVCRVTTPTYAHGKRFNYKSADTDNFNFVLYGNVTVLGNEIELQTPANGYSSKNNSVIFNCSATTIAGTDLTSIELWNNRSGSWVLNESKVVSGEYNSSWFSKNLAEGTMGWTCRGTDDDGDSAFASPNRTITIDTTEPTINASIKQPIIYNDGDDVEINYTITDINLDTVGIIIIVLMELLFVQVV